jgi:uncharacterized protein (DUF1778 family)
MMHEGAALQWLPADMPESGDPAAVSADAVLFGSAGTNSILLGWGSSSLRRAQPYAGRVMGRSLMTTHRRTRSERFEVPTTAEDAAPIDRAVAVTGSDLTDFVVTNQLIAARRVPADRREFVLDAQGREAWERVNRQPTRTLPGLRVLMARPSPFAQ